MPQSAQSCQPSIPHPCLVIGAMQLASRGRKHKECEAEPQAGKKRTSKEKPLVASRPSRSQSEEPSISQAARALSQPTSNTVSRRPPVARTTGTLPYRIAISCSRNGTSQEGLATLLGYHRDDHLQTCCRTTLPMAAAV